MEPGIELTAKKKFSSLLTWVNSFDIDPKTGSLSELSNGLVLARCLELLGFRQDSTVNQSSLEFFASKLNGFYGCNLTNCGALQLCSIQDGKEEAIAKALVLLLCMAVNHSENEHFIEAIRSFPDDVQFDLKYFIETTLKQLDNGRLSSGEFIVDFDRTSINNTPATCSSVSRITFTSPALESWLCSPCTSDPATPKISSSQLFECLEVKELKHQLKLIEKELDIQRLLVTDYEGEIESLSEDRNSLTVSLSEKNERIRQLEDKCEELEHLRDVEEKWQRAEEEIKNLKQQLEVAREESSIRSELHGKINEQHEELKELNQAKNLLQVKLLKYQHQVQELELECKSQQSQSARSLKRCNETLQRLDLLEKQNGDLQNELMKEKEAMATKSDQNVSLQKQNCALSDEVALLQEQYSTVMCTVGSQGQENEQLQCTLHEMEDRYTNELGAKEEQVRILEDQVALLTTRVKKMLADSELQAKEFEDRESDLKAQWEERISLLEAKNSSELTRAKDTVKSCQLTITNITREREEDKLSAARHLHSLEAAHKEMVKKLEQQISDCNDFSEQQVSRLKHCLSEQELQLKETEECLQENIKQLEQSGETIRLLEQKLTSAEFDYSEAEKHHQQQLRQCSDELDKLKGEHEMIVLELSQQLEEMKGKYQILAHANEELQRLIGKKEVECYNLQSAFNKQEQDYLTTIKQCEKLNKEKDMLISDLKQNQIVAKRQEEMLTKNLEELRNVKEKIAGEYEAYRSVMEQKEDGLLREVNKLEQENKMALQKDEHLTGELRQYQETITALQQKLSSSLTKAEEQHQIELRQHSIELEKVSAEYKLQVVELSRQLESATKEHKAFRSKANEQYAQDSEEFNKKMANKEMEYAELQEKINKQDKDHLDALQQFKKLLEDKDKLLVDLKQSQLVGKQQIEQLIHEHKVELQQLYNEKMKMAAEYQAYQDMMQQKEAVLLEEIAELKREKDLTLQTLKENLEKVAIMEDEQNRFIVQIDTLNNTLQCVRSDHKLEVESCQAAIDRGLSANNELEMKNRLLLQELSTVKQESLVLADKLQSCVDTETSNTLLWKQQVKQLQDDLYNVQQQLTSKELSIQQLTNNLLISKEKHCKILALLEEKKEELVELETSHKIYDKNKAALLEERESKIALLQSQLANEKQQSKAELEIVHNENKKLLKSVDELYSQQVASNTQLEQDCRKKLSALEQSNTERLQEITKMQVEMTSLLNELRELKLNYKEVTDCLNVEREKNNLLESEAKQLKATVKAFEQENARVNKLMVQQKYTIQRPSQDEQAHLQQLHAEMDQFPSSCVILEPAEEDENGSSRLEELKFRNSYRPPHLKSCYPVELQLPCAGTPRSSELQLKGAAKKTTSCFDISPPRKRTMAYRHQQNDSPDCVRRRLSAPPTPTSQLQSTKMQLRSYLNNEQDENKPPPRPSDAFEINLMDEQSRGKMEERKSKMFQRMAASRKTHQVVQRSTTTKTVTKPLHTRNTSKKN